MAAELGAYIVQSDVVYEQVNVLATKITTDVLTNEEMIQRGADYVQSVVSNKELQKDTHKPPQSSPASVL